MPRTFRSMSPDSPLYRATSTIDELTLALANFSRASSPEPLHVAVCCCRKEECATSKAWLAYKTKMEARLVLSAEVGQALLERHEAYVRRRESERSPVPTEASDTSEGPVDARVAELVKENAVLEKRLTQALVNNEMSEASNKTTLQELEEVRANMSRLTTQQARSIGWETRLSSALQEKDDMQQERDSAAQRAKLAEARISMLRDKCAKLQAQLVRLREDLDAQRSHRRVMSQEVLQDARLRLAQLQQSGRATVPENTEMTTVLESLVMDNEALKRDNAELRNLLGESREDLRVLQEEIQERRANDVSFARHRYTHSGQSSASSPLSPVFHVGTAPSPSVLHSLHPALCGGRRAASTERASRRVFEPLTPETEQRPLSPADSLMPSEAKWTSFSRASYPSSRDSLENDDDDARASPGHPRAQKTLYPLTRSRGVQTDGGESQSPSSVLRAYSDQASSFASFSPHDGQSESSSVMDNNQPSSTVMSALLERVTTLLTRLSQADAFTLTDRLKRQHLVGADVSHLSRTTVSGILRESAALRAHFRAFLEDDKVTTTCTRRDLRTLLKLVKDMFAEMGQMRVTLNDVILDPSVANKVSEMALHPAKATAETSGVDAGNLSAPGWMAPISKLLGLPSAGPNASEQAASRALAPPVRSSSRGRGRAPSRVVPKREAALSASAMTVNVEFSGTAVGRSVTSTYSAHPEREDSISILSMQSLTTQPVAPVPNGPNTNLSRSVMGIFAGAPRTEDSVDPWIVIPKPQRGFTVPMPGVREGSLTGTGAPSGSASGAATVGRSALRHAASRIGLSRLVDAVDLAGDRPEPQEASPSTLLDRTLIRRGLSDSSIHTTFMNHGEEEAKPAEHETSATQDHQSVLAAISKRMQGFRFAGPTSNADAGRPVSRPETPVSRPNVKSPDREGAHTPTRPRASSPRAIPPGTAGLLRTLNLASWATTALDPNQPPSSSLFGESPREETFMHRTWSREGDY
ncbi:hypothetical protein BKA93DRAFT_747895 [Sparassis latifolia]